MVGNLGLVASLFHLNRTRDHMTTTSLPWPPSSGQDTASTHQFLHKEQGKAVGLLKATANSSSSSSSRFEMSSDSCCFSNSTLTGDRSESFSSASEASVDAVEAVIRGLRSSDRLFCEPAGTSSIVEAERRPAPPMLLFEGSVAVAVDSEDPYWDFRASMEEMVMAHGDADDWGWLEGMLEWYLRANGECSHGIIVEAFVDLLLKLASSPSLFCSATSTTTTTSSCPPFISPADEQMKKENKKMKKMM